MKVEVIVTSSDRGLMRSFTLKWRWILISLWSVVTEAGFNYLQQVQSQVCWNLSPDESTRTKATVVKVYRENWLCCKVEPAFLHPRAEITPLTTCWNHYMMSLWYNFPPMPACVRGSDVTGTGQVLQMGWHSDKLSCVWVHFYMHAPV